MPFPCLGGVGAWRTAGALCDPLVLATSSALQFRVLPSSAVHTADAARSNFSSDAGAWGLSSRYLKMFPKG